MVDTLSTVIKAPIGSVVLLIYVASFYVLTGALLPRQRGHDIYSHIAVAIGLVVVMIGFIELALSYAPWRINFWSLVVALAFVSFANLAIAVGIWKHIDKYDRLRVGELAIWRRLICDWQILSSRDKYSLLFLAISLAMSLGLAPIIASSRHEFYSEFFIDQNTLIEQQSWQEMPERGEPIYLPLTIVSHERRGENFYIEVHVDDQLYHSIDLGNLLPGEETRQTISILMNRSGLHKVAFYLYKDGLTSPYRWLYLWVNVSS